MYRWVDQQGNPMYIFHMINDLENKTLGQILREYRQSVGLGIKSAAPAVGVTYGYLSKVENDKKLPSRGLILKLCNHYKCSDLELSEALKISDKLLAKIGSLPADVKEIVQTYGDKVFHLIRTTYPEEEKEGVNNVDKS